MGRIVRAALAAALAAVAGIGLVGCSGADEPGPDAVVIDVRTPDEYAAGHLEGALNVDVQAADFTARIAELDPEAGYVLYCRSGSRAGVAADQMAALGFDDVTNAGSLEAAADATGLDVVTS